MHLKVASAIEEIDAAVFSSDTFEDPAARASLLEHMAVWAKELAPVEEAAEQVAEPGDDD